jgi:hypothetical protein
MKDGHQLHCYDYVNRPYEDVRAAMLEDPLAVFHRATVTAAARAAELLTTATLRVHVGDSLLSRDIEIRVVGVEEGTMHRSPATKILVEWHALKNQKLFPTMTATLSLYPLSGTETQLDFEGRYQPPLGVVGDIFDGLAGHRLAEAAVLELVREIATWLRVSFEGRAPAHTG